MTITIAIPKGLQAIGEAEYKGFQDKYPADRLTATLKGFAGGDNELAKAYAVMILIAYGQREIKNVMDATRVGKAALVAYRDLSRYSDDVEHDLFPLIEAAIDEQGNAATTISPTAHEESAPPPSSDFEEAKKFLFGQAPTSESPVVIFPTNNGEIHDKKGRRYSVTFRFCPELPEGFKHHIAALYLLKQWDLFFEEGRKFGITHIGERGTRPAPHQEEAPQAPSSQNPLPQGGAKPKFKTEEKPPQTGKSDNKMLSGGAKKSNQNKAKPINMQESPDEVAIYSNDTIIVQREQYIEMAKNQIAEIFGTKKFETKNNKEGLEFLDRNGKKVFAGYLNSEAHLSVENRIDAGGGELAKALRALPKGITLYFSSPLWLDVKENESGFFSVDNRFGVPKSWRINKPFYSKEEN